MYCICRYEDLQGLEKEGAEREMEPLSVSGYSLVCGLSYALDIAGKNNPSHSKGVSYLATLIAREMGLDDIETLDIFYAALLHDIGISDEFIKQELYAKNMKKHCEIGFNLLKELPLPEKIPELVLLHHEYWDGSGAFNRAGGDVPVGSYIIGLSSSFDDKFGTVGIGEFDNQVFLCMQEWLGKLRGLFPGKVLDSFAHLMECERFLFDYCSIEGEACSSLIGDNLDDPTYYQYDDIEKFALCFAKLIDQRSAFTYNHSIGVAKLARKASAHLGYRENTQNRIYIAGLLHDIGKLYILPDMLHKAGALTESERFEMNKHVYFTRRILGSIEGFGDIVEYASNHHERLDGHGYPCKIEPGNIGTLERVMAICDVYQALTEERPYRKGLSSVETWKIIDGMVEKNQLDSHLVSELKKVFD